MAKRKVKILLVGHGELAEKLSRLTDQEAKKVLRAACRNGLKPIQRAAIADAPKDDGTLSRNIKIRSLARSRRRIGARVTIDSKVEKSRYSFVIFGRMTGTARSPSRRKIEPNNFFKDAATAQASQALSIFNDAVDTHIRRVMKGR